MIRQYTLPLPHHEVMGPDDFMVTDSNREAWRWIVETPPHQWPGHALLLYGESGSGKTHLLNIWRILHQTWLLQPGEDVLANLAAPTYALDDAARIAGTPDLEIWLQHLFNATREAGRPLLLAAAAPAKDWGLGLADIKSRLCSIHAVMVQPPDDPLLQALLIKLFADRQLKVDQQTLNYMVIHLPRSPGLIRDFVQSIDRRALEEKRNITAPFIRECWLAFSQKILPTR